MKSIFFLSVVIAIVLVNNVFGQHERYDQPQQYCSSQLIFSEMQRTDPDRYQRFMEDKEMLKKQILNSRNIPTGTIIIPVVVHVVYNPNTPAQNIPDAQIHEQIRVLNEDYRRLNADAANTPTVWQSIAGDANIEFKLTKN